MSSVIKFGMTHPRCAIQSTYLLNTSSFNNTTNNLQCLLVSTSLQTIMRQRII